MRLFEPLGDADEWVDPVDWREVPVEWYCEAWAQRRGVSEPCESGSTHDAPDFDCHWVVRIEGEETE